MRKTAILAGCTLLFIVFMIVVVLLGVNTPAGQRIITGRVNSYLQKKLNVPVHIDHIGIRIPDWVYLTCNKTHWLQVISYISIWICGL
jgi:hypothetical protein